MSTTANSEIKADGFGADKSVKPSSDDMRIAAEWLDVMEGEDAEAAERVAVWLYQQAEAKELRDAAREHGVPVSALRRKIAAQSSSSTHPLEK